MGKKGARNFALGAVIAGAAGYVTGLLTAPKSGKETRHDIQDAALKAKHEAEVQLKKLHSEIDTLINKGQAKLSKGQATVQQDLGDALSKAEVAKEKAREILSALHDGDAEDKDLQKAIEDVKKASSHLKSYLEKKSSN